MTFAYNPTPINVPSRRKARIPKVRGVLPVPQYINKENAGSLAFYGDISNFSRSV